MVDTAGWAQFFIFGWGTPFAAYVALQVLALLTLRRYWWYCALIPVPFMLWLLVVTLDAYRSQSNMWPMLMILVSPFVALGVAIYDVVGLRVQSHPRRRELTVATFVIVVVACLSYAYMSEYAA